MKDRHLFAQVVGLQRMAVGELRARYVKLFGDDPCGRNRDYLWKRIAFLIQERSRPRPRSPRPVAASWSRGRVDTQCDLM